MGGLDGGQGRSRTELHRSHSGDRAGALGPHRDQHCISPQGPSYPCDQLPALPATLLCTYFMQKAPMYLTGENNKSGYSNGIISFYTLLS